MTYAFNTLAGKDRNPDKPAYDASKHPLVMVNFAGNALVFIADPEAVQDFYIKQ